MLMHGYWLVVRLMQLERAWHLEARLFTLVVAPVDVLSIRAA